MQLVILCWASNTFTILALASRAFAFYYFVQCMIAIFVSKRVGERVMCGVVAVALLFVTGFATPVG